MNKYFKQGKKDSKRGDPFGGYNRNPIEPVTEDEKMFYRAGFNAGRNEPLTNCMSKREKYLLARYANEIQEVNQ